MMTGVCQMSFFKFMNQMWGPYDIDRFANHENAKLTRFDSLVWNPGCEAVDAFSQNWHGENNWLLSPIYLIPNTMKHMVFCRAIGTLLVPEWPLALFWPFFIW